MDNAAEPLTCQDRQRTRSCAECRRRRIRCEGHTTPCRQCVYYQVPHLCHYPVRKRRHVYSASAYAELSDAYEASQSVLGSLFPTKSLDEIASMPREQLVALVNGQGPVEKPAAAGANVDDEMEGLQSSPDQIFEWDEVGESRRLEPRAEDDVNGLSSLFSSSHSSFLGISSVPTILRVIVQSSPSVRDAIRDTRRREPASIPSSVDSPSPAQPPEMNETVLVDAYFRHVHGVTPMVDEADFRRCRAQGVAPGRNHSPWLALLNMVLCMGYIAHNDDSQPGHGVFYTRASKHLDMSCFGSGHLYTVQALGLFGGYYLHYLNRPNMASAVMGAALRMAVAIGLHQVKACPSAPARRSITDTRICTWWSLFCLDTWAGTTLGRPSLGAWNASSTMTSSPPLRGALDYESISLRASEAFCKIAIRIQDRMAQLPIMTPAEIRSFDEELLAWKTAIHPVFQDSQHCPEPLRAARGMLRCRLATLRLTLYRPYLLHEAIRKTTSAGITDDERAISSTCLAVALETIDVVALDWFPNQISAWNGSWHLFQAATVVLLSLSSRPEDPTRGAWEGSVHRGLELLGAMQPWRASAARTGDVVRFLHEAMRSSREDAESLLALPEDVFLDMLELNESENGFEWADLFGFGASADEAGR